LQSSREELAEHHVTTRTELASELPLISGHKRQLQQVISNLVQNAIEAMDYTTNRDRVLRVRTARHNRDAIIVAVEDSGPGIDSKKLGSIFEAFFTTKSHGVGLGLAICRMIVERHGGQLTVASDWNHGARFQFVLPTKFSDGAPAN
jgi:signal transduction histidine kinase